MVIWLGAARQVAGIVRVLTVTVAPQDWNKVSKRLQYPHMIKYPAYLAFSLQE
jgi:hypothetical protein